MLTLKWSISLIEQLVKSPCYKTVTVEREGVETAFVQTGESKIEILQTTRPDGPIGKFIARKGEGIHHIAFAVENIEVEVMRLQVLGFEVLSDTSKPGADGKLVCLLHPKGTYGVLVELCMDDSDL